MLKFMPSDFRLQEVRQAPLKDQYDEWLARLICYAFSVPVTPFVGTVNRATSEMLRLQATQEGLIPLRAWIKDALDRIVQTYLGAPDLEFVWVGDARWRPEDGRLNKSTRPCSQEVGSKRQIKRLAARPRGTSILRRVDRL